MTLDVIVTILVAIAYAVGIAGIIVPVLPGSGLILLATLIWAVVVGGWISWVAFALVAIFSITGMVCSYVLTGKKLKQQEIPNWAILASIAGGIVGMFVIPGPGLIIGFILALFLVEYSRRKDAGKAWKSTLEALKTLGIGILLELGLAIASATVFAIAAGVAFFA